LDQSHSLYLIPDNGEEPDLLIGVANQSAEVSGELWTLEWDNIKQMRGDIDVKTTSATDGSETYSTGGLSAQAKVIVRAEQRTRRAATAADVLKYVSKEQDGQQQQQTY